MLAAKSAFDGKDYAKAIELITRHPKLIPVIETQRKNK